ncbi:VOC family protein [Fodinisporobacter ferrooxydans]|uniref:VOC family protein n=1 Tax=Fodinisporobacter ferrooxydans TaxID=2901836 RepID=A0ABY4CN17_9BACL|nr:VOC family protein [Alicyclobacillaceae bacterium MYW30-H2]
MLKLHFFGENTKFHHIGLGIEDVAKINLDSTFLTHDPIQKVKVGFVQVGDCCVEIIEPVGEQSPVRNSIKKGNKLMHICFEVNDLDEALRQAEQNAFKVIQKPVPAEAFNQRKIAWVYHPNWGLYELLESGKDSC